MFSEESKDNIGKKRVNVIPTKASAKNGKIHGQNHTKQSPLSQNKVYRNTWLGKSIIIFVKTKHAENKATWI